MLTGVGWEQVKSTVGQKKGNYIFYLEDREISQEIQAV